MNLYGMTQEHWAEIQERTIREFKDLNETYTKRIAELLDEKDSLLARLTQAKEIIWNIVSADEDGSFDVDGARGLENARAFLSEKE